MRVGWDRPHSGNRGGPGSLRVEVRRANEQGARPSTSCRRRRGTRPTAHRPRPLRACRQDARSAHAVAGPPSACRRERPSQPDVCPSGLSSVGLGDGRADVVSRGVISGSQMDEELTIAGRTGHSAAVAPCRPSPRARCRTRRPTRGRRSHSSGSRTTPPSPTWALPTSNCGLTRTTIRHRRRATPTRAGRTESQRYEREVGHNSVGDPRKVIRCEGPHVHSLHHCDPIVVPKSASRVGRNRHQPRSTAAAPRCSRQSVNPPVEAPASSHLCPWTSIPSRSSAPSSLSPPRDTNRRGASVERDRSVGSDQSRYSLRSNSIDLDDAAFDRKLRFVARRNETPPNQFGVQPEVSRHPRSVPIRANGEHSRGSRDVSRSSASSASPSRSSTSPTIVLVLTFVIASAFPDAEAEADFFVVCLLGRSSGGLLWWLFHLASSRAIRRSNRSKISLRGDAERRDLILDLPANQFHHLVTILLAAFEELTRQSARRDDVSVRQLRIRRAPSCVRRLAHLPPYTRTVLSLIPISDANPTRRFPVVTVGLIIANIIAFFRQPTFAGGAALDRFFFEQAPIPCQLADRCPDGVQLTAQDVVVDIPQTRSLVIRRRDRRLDLPPCEASFTSQATCCSSGSSATTSRTTWAG